MGSFPERKPKLIRNDNTRAFSREDSSKCRGPSLFFLRIEYNNSHWGGLCMTNVMYGSPISQTLPLITSLVLSSSLFFS